MFNLEYVTNAGDIEFQLLALDATSLDEAKAKAQEIADAQPDFLLGQVQAKDGLVLHHVVPAKK